MAKEPAKKKRGGGDPLQEFCRSLPHQCGVVAVPNQVFYARVEHGRHLVRFACCKRLDVIDDAVNRLSKLAEVTA